MIDTVFGIKVRMSGLSINRYRPIVRRRLSAGRLLAIALSVNLYVTMPPRTSHWQYYPQLCEPSEWQRGTER